MESVFFDLLKAAGRADLSEKIKTADLPEERKIEQFSKLKNLRAYKNGAMKLVNNCFVARYEEGETAYLCIQTDLVGSDAEESASYLLAEYGAIPAILDESTFLFIAHEFRGFYVLKPQYFEVRQAKEIIDIADDELYVGHDIGELISAFKDIKIFAVDKNSVLATADIWFLAATLASAHTKFRSELLGNIISNKIAALLQLGNVNPENIYYALTSMHWKHCFLELYKCLESLHFLPWILRLKESTGLADDGYTLSKKVSSSLLWRGKEGQSTELLFAMLQDDTALKDEVFDTEAFKDLKGVKFDKATVGRRIYKIRNFLVHQEDYEDDAPIGITERCWPAIVCFLVDVISELYKKNAYDVNFRYLLSPTAGQAST
ncbi:hypothetical protein [Sphingomonas sp. CARO-RG-8B-R24-01]|uniref:hypothetical protein n=1 Tax=Sphingomonas sp. CARO-RG-8B-R24-01 TaxID=2914831 RepID=UPI001F56276B|nr:hypothetical protein [Sphingomonas sp. CARO-RG-8B-R24-01]